MIELKALTKSFEGSAGRVVALSEIDLTINDGEIFGIIGLSGAGKSTLVRCINLLERPDSGSVIIDGVDITQLKTRELLKVRQNIGMIFQGFNLLEQRNIIDNVCFPLEIAGVSRYEALERARELLDIVGISDKEKAYPSQLSGGQKQRVAIARALATQPKYLLCDEATSALDPNTTTAILALLKEINKKLGVTVIIITHEMDVIDRICNRVAVIDKSQIVECGDVTEVFTCPKSEIARELVLPKMLSLIKNDGSYYVRLVFNGESSGDAVISRLVTDCACNMSILFADIKEIHGKNFGQMLIKLPKAETDFMRVAKWLEYNGVKFSVETKD
jgi:D-methionine transport system ATP-binding protein